MHILLGKLSFTASLYSAMDCILTNRLPVLFTCLYVIHTHTHTRARARARARARTDRHRHTHALSGGGGGVTILVRFVYVCDHIATGYT